MFRKVRVQAVKFLIDINEALFFERRLTRVYKRLGGEHFGVIIDVGSNKGQSINFFKALNKACHIYGFEPNPQLYKNLVAKYQSDPTIVLFNQGISNKVGSRIFHQNILDYTSTFEDLNEASSYLRKKSRLLGINQEEIIVSSYPIQTTTLSDFVNQQVNTMVDVLKIDVEGHEYHCLQGLFTAPLKVDVKFIQLEQHNDDMYLNKIPFEEIHSLLNRNNFELKETVKHGYSDLAELVFSNKKLIQ